MTRSCSKGIIHSSVCCPSQPQELPSFVVFWWCLILLKTVSHATHKGPRPFCSENISIFVPCIVTSIPYIWPDLVPIVFSGKILLYLRVSPYTWWTLKAMHCDKMFKLLLKKKKEKLSEGYFSNINNSNNKLNNDLSTRPHICSQFQQLLKKLKGTIQRV